MGTLFLLLVLLVGVLLLGWLLISKLPQLRMLDPSTVRELQEQALKAKLMRERIERAGRKRFEQAQKLFFKPTGRMLQDGFRRFAGKLTAVERRYQQKKKTADSKLTPADLSRMVKEGRDFIAREEWDSAEKRFIEVISNDPKNVEAFECLGRLYFKRKDHTLAKQTFEYLLKISPNDASVLVSLGELALLDGKPQKAFSCFQKATEKRDKNPRYLDFLIQSAISMGDVHESRQALDRLRAVNPENKKIEEFEKRIAEIRKK